MENKKKQFLSVLLILSAITAAAVGCQNQETVTEDTDISPVTDAESQTSESSYLDTVPQSSAFSEMNFRIGYISPFEINEVYYTNEETAGDIVNEAVYKRNRLTEEKLGIRITGSQFCDTWEDVMTTLQMQVESEDCPYEALLIPVVWGFQSSLNGLLIDMSTISSLDFSHPWWDNEAIEMYSFNTNKRYIASGKINYLDDYALSCFLFNKKLCEEYDLAYPYQAVKDGTWTFDLMNEYIMNLGIDVDGNNAMDQNDIYGMVGNLGVLNTYLCGIGEHIIEIDSEGRAVLNQSERFYNVLDKLCSTTLVIDNPAVCIVERKLGYDIGNTIFPNGHALFATNSMIGSMAEYRLTMEDDFGVLPFPKYDEEQESYHSLMNQVYGTTVSVPITNTATENTGWILDVMGYYSQDTIYPAVIEKNIIAKSARDEESVEMLEILMNNKFFELGGWGSTVYDKMMNISSTGKNNYASTSEKIKNITEKEFATIADIYFQS